jgi:hypothetical protein
MSSTDYISNRKMENWAKYASYVWGGVNLPQFGGNFKLHILPDLALGTCSGILSRLKIPAAFPKSCFFHAVIWLGCT